MARGINPITHGSELHTDVMKTQALRQALDKHGFDRAFGGARRDEEKSRAKERIFSFRNAQHRWDPKRQRPEPWRLYNGRKRRGESIRVFPLSNWTELDVWLYIHQERIPVVPLYFAAPRPVVERDGTADHGRRRPAADGRGRTAQMREVRFRTLGCYPLTGAIESDAVTVAGIVRETAESRVSERRTARSITTAPPRWSARSRKAISDECASGHGLLRARFLPVAAGEQEPAALRRLRLGRSRQVDADRTAAVRPRQRVRRPTRRRSTKNSRKHGTTGEDLDFSLLLDGLAAEREQKITIDVAYRFFSTARRKFIVADTPGHEQYTRNMATGASTADLALLLVDARHGPARANAPACSYRLDVGVRHIALAVNKMDKVGWSEDAFREIEHEFRAYAGELGIESLVCIPAAARSGRQCGRAFQQHGLVSRPDHP